MRKFQIGNKNINSNSKSFIIAEIGMNHNGNIDLCTEMIKSAAKSNANAVKLQTFKVDKFLNKNFMDFEERKKYEFSYKDYKTISSCAKDLELDFFSTPLDNDSVDLLIDIGVDIIKIASSDLTNLPLLEKISNSNKSIIFSTGYSLPSEIHKAYETLKSNSASDIAILHCVASYPTSLTDINLNNIKYLKSSFPDSIIGFSDHSEDFEIVCPSAVSMGAKIIEKHFTTDRNLPGYDHNMSLDPKMFSKMVENIRKIEEALGESRDKTGRINTEKTRITNARRSLYWSKNLNKGHKIEKSDLIPKRPGIGIPPNLSSQIIGLSIVKDIKDDTLIKYDQFE